MEKDRKLVAIYARLSAEDGLDDMSVSIENQIEICKEFANSNGFSIYKIYYDDGFSGTNFERPAFLEMIDDLDNNCFNCIIVKDLSRFGRHFLKVSYYLEDYFPSKNIRFISINEKYDSASNEDNDLNLALRNFLNGYFAKECSRKRRFAIENKAQTKTLATEGCYGYYKNNDILQIDQEAADVVRYIFNEYANGTSVKSIINNLEKNEIKTPSYYKIEKYQDTGHPYPLSKDGRYKWKEHSVYHILNDETYLGTTINFRIHSPRYGSKSVKNVYQKKISNTHEPIIDSYLFEQCQDRLTKKRKKNIVTDEERLLQFVFYEDGRVFSFARAKIKGKYKYQRYYLKGDYSFWIDAKALHSVLYKDALNVINKIKIDPKLFINKIVGKYNTKQVNDNINDVKKQITILERKKEKLFEDLILDVITKEEFENENELLINEIKLLNKKYNDYMTTNSMINSKINHAKKFIQQIEKCDLQCNNIILIKEIINKVIIKGTKNNYKIKIIYNFEI